MRQFQIVSAAAVAVVSAIGVIWAIKRHRNKQSPRKTFGRELREAEFCFDVDVCPCNNGSFGGVPRRLLHEQQRLMEECERNPSLYNRRHYSPQYFPPEERYTNYEKAINVVADFVGARSRDLVIVENSTVASNSILWSLPFGKGDKILITSHTYGAVGKLVRAVCEKTGAEAVVLDIPLPIESEDHIINLYSETLRNHKDIKVAVIDHITSPSAILMPVRRLAELCHENGVKVVVDGAHAPGQISLNIQELCVDFYFGNLHKWVFAPRGCAFLWVHPDHHNIVKPGIVSHNHFAPTLEERFRFLGTRDYLPFFMASSAIKFHNDLGGLEEISRYNSSLLDWAADMLAKAFDTEQLPVPAHMRAPFMRLVAVPETDRYPVSDDTCGHLMFDIYNHNGVVVVISNINQRLWFRVSGHVYNYKDDYYKLRDSVLAVLQIQ